MRRRTRVIPGAMFVFCLAFTIFAANALAAPERRDINLQSTPSPDPLLSISNSVCIDCHGQPGLDLELENGDILDLYISPDEYNASVHGKSGYACVQCHRQVGNYPHPPFQADDLRDASLQLYQACQGCHQHQYELAQDSVHAAALNKGTREAAVCTDCHTAHAVQRLHERGTRQLLPEARAWVPQTCARCHSAIYDQYRESVHGSALFEESNLDVPTCIDCHSVHNIHDPTTISFRLRSSDICAKCHTDEQRMAKYGLSTEVLNTYVADFHGTTVMLFEKLTPDAQTNKPVCYDCHGIHDIRRTDDPTKGLHVRENLLNRCQVCHPNATSNFSTAWLSHYVPSPDKNPIVYYVNQFYRFFIPTVLGGMALLVLLDLNKLLRGKIKVKSVEEATEEAEVIELSSAIPADDAQALEDEVEMTLEEIADVEEGATGEEASQPPPELSDESVEENHQSESDDETELDEEQTND